MPGLLWAALTGIPLALAAYRIGYRDGRRHGVVEGLLRGIGQTTPGEDTRP